MRIQLKRSLALEDGKAKEPSPSQLEYGEIAVNFNDTDPAIFFKDSDNNIIRVAGDGAVGSGNGDIDFTSGPGLYITNPVFTLDQQTDQTIDVAIVLDSEAERVGLELVTDSELDSGGYLRAKTASPSEKGVIKEPAGGVGVYMRQVTSDGYVWVQKDATVALPSGYPNLSDGSGNTLDNRYLNKNINQTYAGPTLTISQNLTVGGATTVNTLTSTGGITGNVTGDLTGNADTADFATDATNATNATNSTNCSRSVIAGNGLTGGGVLNTNRTINVAADDSTIVVSADGIRVDQSQLNFTPAANNGQINITASNGLQATGSNATANQSGNTTRTISGINASTSAKGVVQLNNTVTSTSTTQAATANAASSAYNRAASYAPAKDGTNATGEWDIDISGNAATADVAAFVSGNVATADLATSAINVRVDQTTGNTNRPFAFYADTTSASGSYIRLYRDSAATCFINPSTNTIGATTFTGTNVNASGTVTGTTVTATTYTSSGNLTIQPGGETQGYTLNIFPGVDDDGIAGNIVIGKGTTNGTGGHIYFRGGGGADQYRFAKSGQTTAEGFLSFESLTADRVFTFPNASVTLAGKNINNSFTTDQTFETKVLCDTYVGRGTEITINAGEAEGKFSGQTGEAIYMNAEAGVIVTTPTVDNFAAGYGPTKTIITGKGVYLHNGETRVGEITTNDTTWLRINNDTAKNIYTPRYIRADGGFFVDGSAKGINGSGNFVGGTIAGASDVSNANDANTIPIRNGNGDFSCRLVRQEYQDDTTISGGIVFRKNASSDNYLRVCNNTSAIRTFLGVTGTGADANYLRSNAGDTFNSGTTSNILRYQMTNGLKANVSTGNLGPLEIYQATLDSDAFITFHIANDYAAYFGLDGTTNDLFFGGWSKGAYKHRIWHEGNDGSGTGLDADKVDGIHASSFLRSDANDTATGELTFNGKVNIRGHLDISDGEYIYWGSSDDMTMYYNSNNWFYWDFKTAGNGIVFRDSSSDVVIFEDSGVFRPAVNNTGYLGTSSYYWSNAYVVNATVSSTLSVRGAIDLADSDVLRFGSSDDITMYYNGGNNWLYINSVTSNGIIFQDNGTNKIILEDSGVIRPNSDVGATLGTSTVNWSSLYTAAIRRGDAYITLNTNANGNWLGFRSDYNQGLYRFYKNKGTSYVDVYFQGTGTTNRNIQFPDVSGTVALTSSSITGNAATATTATNVQIDSRTNNQVDHRLAFVTSSDGASQSSARLRLSNTLKCNPGSGTITATKFTGELNGNASTATLASQATTINTQTRNAVNSEHFITFTINNGGGQQSLYSDSSLTYNPNLNRISGIGSILGRTANDLYVQAGEVTGSANSLRIRGSKRTDYEEGVNAGGAVVIGDADRGNVNLQCSVLSSVRIFKRGTTNRYGSLLMDDLVNSNRTFNFPNVNGTIDVTSTSDRRLKKNIVSATSQWNTFKNLNWVNFDYIEDEILREVPEYKHFGLIAQEVEEVLPDAVSDISVSTLSDEMKEVLGDDTETYKIVDYKKVAAHSMKALQEAILRIEALEARLSALES